MLLCLPYAGASATIYYKLNPFLEERIKMIPIELSGRGTREDEPLLFSFEDAVDDVISEIEYNVDSDDEYMLLGYSFGSILSYEAILRLKKKPLHLFLAAFQPPMYKSSYTDTLRLNDKDFVYRLVETGGIDNSVIKDMKLFEPFIPIIRADYSAVEDYKFKKPRKKIKCNATIFYTKEDEYSEKIRDWNHIFDFPCEYKEFAGDHFFIRREYNKIAHIINSVAMRYL
nr:thioesterase domain-containing protein [Anaeromonas gelatinilytica]